MSKMSSLSAAGHVAMLIGTFSVSCTLCAFTASASEIPTTSVQPLELRDIVTQQEFDITYVSQLPQNADFVEAPSDALGSPEGTDSPTASNEPPGSAPTDPSVETPDSSSLAETTTEDGGVNIPSDSLEDSREPSDPGASTEPGANEGWPPPQTPPPTDDPTPNPNTSANEDQSGGLEIPPASTNNLTGSTDPNGTTSADATQPNDDESASPTNTSSDNKKPANASTLDIEKPDVEPSVNEVATETMVTATRKASVSTSLDVLRGTITIVARDGAFSDSWGVSFELTGPNGTQWAAATRQADGSWAANLSMEGLGSGSISVQAWANRDGAVATLYASATVAIPSTHADLSLAYDSTHATFVVSARNVSCPTGVTFISVGVTAPSGTTQWYRLALQPDGTWSTSVNPAHFGWEAGSYTLVGSICDATWTGRASGTAHSTISFGAENVTGSLESDGRLILKAQGERYAQAWGVSFAVNGSQGTSWVAASRQKDGSWQASLPGGALGSGSVQVTAWANISSVAAFAPASTSVAVPKSQAKLSLSFDPNLQRIVIQATEVTCPTGVTFVSVGLTSPKGTTVWYRLDQQANGSWRAYINPSTFDWQSGSYTIAASICDGSWNGIPASTAVSKLSYGAESLTSATSSDGTKLTVQASGGRYAQAWNVSFQVVSSSKSSWVAGTRQDDGSWILNATPSTWDGGRLTINAYASIGSTTIFLGSTQVTTPSLTASFSCTPQPKNDTVLAVASGGAFASASNVAFEVYNLTENSGSSWYQAQRQSDGSWTASIPADVEGVGTCVATAWATSSGTTKAIDSTRYTYNVVPTIVDEIDLGSGGYNVSYGMSGLKVQRIQQALGIGSFNFPRYLDETVSAVKNFQGRVGLSATGVVDRATWISLGLDEQEWYTLGAYASPVRVSATASASERIEAMINHAKEYLGDPYVWDAAGAPGQGVDCAGLVMQSLYAAGLSTGIINPITHATTGWGDHDASNFYNYGGFTKTSPSERLRGDLIYYGSNSIIDHVAIYLGNDQIIEAYPNNVRINTLWKSTILGVTRVFM